MGFLELINTCPGDKAHLESPSANLGVMLKKKGEKYDYKKIG